MGSKSQSGRSDYPVSYTHLRAHETVLDLVCRLLLEKKKKKQTTEKAEAQSSNKTQDNKLATPICQHAPTKDTDTIKIDIECPDLSPDRHIK